MNRLTEKFDNEILHYDMKNECGVNNLFEYIVNATNKLGKLEDIEEELGLPLTVYVYLTQKYFKEQRIYIENIYDDEKEKELTKQVNGRKQRYIIDIDFVKKIVFIQGSEKWARAKFKDYGKTWALTKKELEFICKKD